MSNAELYEDMLACDDENYESQRARKTSKRGHNSYHEVKEKIDTHIVIKREDVFKYLTEVEQIALDNILNTISKARQDDGKSALNTYYVCNTDEPYAEVVHGIIMGGEEVKSKLINRNLRGVKI